MRLIDADELGYECKISPSGYLYVTDDDIINATTIDAEPVRYGHWVLERDPGGKPYCFHCSACDGDFHYIGIKSATKYCPNCGAKMDYIISKEEQ